MTVMKKDRIICVSLFLAFSSLTGCSEDEPTEDVDPRLATFSDMKESWTLGIQTIVKDKLVQLDSRKWKTEEEDLKLFEIFFEQVARDMSHYYSGERGIITAENLRLVRFLKKKKLIPEEKMGDPFMALERFKIDPNKKVLRIFASDEILENLHSYQKFCAWLEASIDLCKPADIQKKD